MFFCSLRGGLMAVGPTLHILAVWFENRMEKKEPGLSAPQVLRPRVKRVSLLKQTMGDVEKHGKVKINEGRQ